MEKAKTQYTCPMHPEVVQDHPGTCPKCGGMSLVAKAPRDKDLGHHNHHDHASMMTSPEAVQNFLRRFYIVTVLLVPLVLLSPLGVDFLGIPDFAYRSYLLLSIASAIFYFSLIFFEHARHEIMAKKYGMMTLVSIAVGAGYLFSVVSTFLPQLEVEFYLEISTLIWVLLFGHYLEARSSSAAGDALKEVAKLLPKEALRLRSGQAHDQTERVAIDELKKDDIIIVKPGEKVPADGVIIKGMASFNESHLSGESKPVEKKEQDKAIAGAICMDSTVEIRIEKIGEDSTIGQIQKLISEARNSKPSAQRLADRAARWLTFIALTVSLATLLTWTLVIGETVVFAVTLAITVLVIACPHALGLAIPTVSTIAQRLSLKNGIFIKNMAKLEVIKKADYVVFDKTGTLTKGKPELKNFKIMQNVQEASKSLQLKLPRSTTVEQYIKSVVLTLENASSHVIALEVAEKLKKEKKVKELSFSTIKNIAGKGIFGKIDTHDVYIGTRDFMINQKIMMCAELDKDTQGWQKQGQTIGYVAIDGKHIASFSLADTVKNESKKAVNDLHNLRLKVAMLTGDNTDVAASVADEIGIDTVFAQVLPEDKFKHVKSLQNDGHIVVMVGDGVNDAPALTAAHVGVAIGAGTDIAVEAGDVVLTQSNPGDIVRLIILSRKVYRKMIENLLWALGYNVIAIPAAAGLFIPFGIHLTPEVGAIAMSLSSVVVVVNAMALRKAKLSIV
ncbi:MAG: Copper-translocating P-type ATPase [Candidatus Roizmanbacteria bacterium GW2011_GWA1_41_13]|uniref:Copper-translocating P-type ATPase n=1 Tax=Candidatus Roizmanbacteria bacterium GW2011_GWA1_41_13 TaxID=1618474 RepID=A0A0G0UZE8_9BACT|nr:MAG: Copper-translocating P-type ATPase [Candidatus Roizmanbacteria bacterium GW2011_GWA1_41_13]